jgi:hypothetical protein
MNISDKLYTMGDHLVSNFYTFVVICVDWGYFGNIAMHLDIAWQVHIWTACVY